MPRTLVELPLPSSWGHFGLEERPKRTWVVTCRWDDMSPAVLEIRFVGVQVFTCSYLGHCTPDATQAAYDKLVDLNDPDGDAAQNDSLLRLMIVFDDGPCLEVVCEAYEVVAIGNRERRGQYSNYDATTDAYLRKAEEFFDAWSIAG
jgi:hypothetical protein